MKKEEFIKLNLMYDLYTWKELGEIANVHFTTICIWLKQEGIKKSKKYDYKTIDFPVELDPNKKVCHKCKISKTFKDFSKNNTKKGGYEDRCKLCASKHLYKYYRENREKCIALCKKNIQDRIKTDINFRLMSVIRNRHCKVLKGITSTTKGLGCNSLEFRNHIENLFMEGMTWENRWSPGKDTRNNWSLDHIIPLYLYDKIDEETNSKIIHYSNIRPLWHIENLKRKKKPQMQN